VAGPDKDDKYVDVRTANNSIVSLNNNAPFTGVFPHPLNGRLPAFWPV